MLGLQAIIESKKYRYFATLSHYEFMESNFTDFSKKGGKSKDMIESNLDSNQRKTLKTKLQKDLTPQEIQEKISKWDLKNPSPKDKILIEKVKDKELEQLQKDFNFKGNYEVAREIDAQHLAHVVNRHIGKDADPANIPFKDTQEVLDNYPKITRDYDTRTITNNNSIIYTKQINGHFIAIEEVLSGLNKLRFVSAWKTKGNINENVLFKNAKR